MSSAVNNPENLGRWAVSLDDDDLFSFIRGKVKTKKVIAAVEELIRRYNNREWQCSNEDLQEHTYFEGADYIPLKEINDKFFEEMN